MRVSPPCVSVFDTLSLPPAFASKTEPFFYEPPAFTLVGGVDVEAASEHVLCLHYHSAVYSSNPLLGLCNPAASSLFSIIVFQTFSEASLSYSLFSSAPCFAHTSVVARPSLGPLLKKKKPIIAAVVRVSLFFFFFFLSLRMQPCRIHTIQYCTLPHFRS